MPKRILQGTVISNKADKTISVLVERKIMHPVYKKYIKPNHHLVRFHIGLEDPKDLIEDLRKAIKKIR